MRVGWPRWKSAISGPVVGSWPGSTYGKALTRTPPVVPPRQRGRAGWGVSSAIPFDQRSHQPRWWDVAVNAILDKEGKPERLLAVFAM